MPDSAQLACHYPPTEYPTDNLVSYIQSAVLPPLPYCLSGRDTLLASPQLLNSNYPSFRHARRLTDDFFNSRVQEHTRLLIPKASPGRNTFEGEWPPRGLTVPHPTFYTDQYHLGLALGIHAVYEHIAKLPLATVSKIIQILSAANSLTSEMCHWPVINPVWKEGYGFGDFDGLGYVVWGHNFTYASNLGSPYAELLTKSTMRSAIVVTFESDWAFDGGTALHEFTGYCSNPQEASTRASELWRKILHLCRERDTSYFVYSTYNYWIFGSFSLDWTHATVSPVKTYDCQGPTILECLCCWLLESNRDERKWLNPDVAELSEVEGSLEEIAASPTSNKTTVLGSSLPSRKSGNMCCTRPDSTLNKRVDDTSSQSYLSNLVTARGEPTIQLQSAKTEDVFGDEAGWIVDPDFAIKADLQVNRCSSPDVYPSDDGGGLADPLNRRLVPYSPLHNRRR
ncbi:hypothetical protein JAAARDRAFT_48328 [Jaapia argillacea MUCL 33604]|uniref:Uncharacterized protein n=1 Tax=Jaapia argillacea MUCL 33604 TaxID=933084 RepID=A0A067PZ05_9AGAM|nr:hypothetical protein JAAARDRAFT_48328 [Jaapia argillacea MUCL 33604]